MLQHINGKTRDQLQQFNIRQFFDELGIASRLSETRLNGLKQIEEILHNPVIMYQIEPFFKLTALENDIGQQSRLLNAVTDQWRYNGQIIGREIPLYLTEEDGEQGFAMRVICPEQDSLLPENNNQTVNLAMENAEKCGLNFKVFKLLPMFKCRQHRRMQPSCMADALYHTFAILLAIA